jgi:WD40 repeat protein
MTQSGSCTVLSSGRDTKVWQLSLASTKGLVHTPIGAIPGAGLWGTTAARWSHDNSQIFTASENGVLQAFSVASGESSEFLDPAATAGVKRAAVRAIAVGTASKELFAAGDAGVVTVFDTSSKALTKVLKVGSKVNAIALGHSSTRLASATETGQIVSESSQISEHR